MYRIFFSLITILATTGIIVNNNAININNKSLQISVSTTTQTTASSTLNILMGGDIMFDRHIRKMINKYVDEFLTKYLNNISDINNKYDYVIANLEGPITTNNSLTLNQDGSFNRELLFTFPTSSIKILKDMNVHLVSLANNHTDNFYLKGYKQTVDFLNADNIGDFGNPYNNNEYNISTKYCKNDICVTYIGYNQFTRNNNSKLIIDEIKKMRIDSDFIIVMPHWGEEYQLKANQNQINLAHAWIDAGADAVIGSHPHVIQNKETYKDKIIYYSLGNYIFDQWWNSDVSTGLVLSMEFNKDGASKSLSIKEEKRIKITKTGIKYE